jgi:hypothetical protein
LSLAGASFAFLDVCARIKRVRQHLREGYGDFELVFWKSKSFFTVCVMYCLGAILHIVRQRKHYRALRALFFPIAAVLFLIGWSLSWIGSQKQPRKTHGEPPKDHVHLKAITLEEPTEITN